jgi:cytochrome c-type biogenesis protein CcmH/NrfF
VSLSGLRKNSCSMSLRGATGDQESHQYSLSRARFLAEFTQSPFTSFRAVRKWRANGLEMTRLQNVFWHRAKELLKILVLGLALTSVAMAARSPAQIEQDIGNEVYCLCGCVTTLNHCPHENCPVKAEMHKIISTDLAEGKTEPAILQDLVNRYGEKVLAAPPPHGFNLAAWILPGLGLLLGLLVAIAIVRRWLRPAFEAAASASPVDDNVRAAVEEEMKKFVG